MQNYGHNSVALNNLTPHEDIKQMNLPAHTWQNLCYAVWCNTFVLHSVLCQLSAVICYHFQVWSSFSCPRLGLPIPLVPYSPTSLLFILFSPEAYEYMNDNSVWVTAEICRHCPVYGWWQRWQRVRLIERQLAHQNPQQSFTCKHFVWQPPLCVYFSN